MALTPNQFQAIGLALFGVPFFVLVVFLGEDVTFEQILWLLAVMLAGTTLVGYGAGLRDDSWG